MLSRFLRNCADFVWNLSYKIRGDETKVSRRKPQKLAPKDSWSWIGAYFSACTELGILARDIKFEDETWERSVSERFDKIERLLHSLSHYFPETAQRLDDLAGEASDARAAKRETGFKQGVATLIVSAQLLFRLLKDQRVTKSLVA